MKLARKMLVAVAVLSLAAIASGCCCGLGRWTSPIMEDVREFAANEKTRIPEMKAELARYKDQQNQTLFRPDPQY